MKESPVPCWHRGLEWRTPNYFLVLSRLQRGVWWLHGPALVSRRGVDVSEEQLSRGTWGISYPWSATSFLVVFWQVSPCSRPESGSSEAHENKQYIKTLLSTHTKFQKTRNYSAILVFILMSVPIFSFPNTLLGYTPTKTPFPEAYFKYRKKLHRLSLFCKNLQELSWPGLCHPQRIFKVYFIVNVVLRDWYCTFNQHDFKKKISAGATAQ